MSADLPLVVFPDAPAWEAFLEQAGPTSPGVWLKIAKAGGRATSVSYSDALDVALCHGWIDSQKGAVDEVWFKQRFTRRGPKSKWSRINLGKVEMLIAAGRMRPAGLAQVEAAQADGRWAAAYAGARTIDIPEDLRVALDREPAAAVAFAELDGANRYAFLYRVHEARRPETRARRIETFVAMLLEGRTIHARPGEGREP